MAGFVIRKDVVDKINQRFGTKGIKKTAKELHPLLQAGGDVFDMVHKYGILDADIKQHRVGGDISRYKEAQSMPHLHKVLLTHAFRHAVTHKIPIKFNIAAGKEEGIEVKTSSRSVTVTLTRVDPPRRKR
jgi:hypothetical protein